MIWRVRDRATFQTLQRDGRRARRGPVTVVYLPATQRPARVAFAINRRVGNAVVRNKVRRRLRAIVGDLDRALAGDGGLPAGTYLLTVRPEVTSLSYRELGDRVWSGCEAVTAATAAERTNTPGTNTPGTNTPGGDAR